MDANIDPDLLALDNDPSMQFFARNRPQSPLHDDATSEPGGEPDEFQGHSSSLHDIENDEDNHGTKAHNLRSFSQMIMRRKKLSDRAASDFNIYCEASTHSLLEFTITDLFFYISDWACGGAFSPPLCPHSGEPGVVEGIDKAWTMGYIQRT